LGQTRPSDAILPASAKPPEPGMLWRCHYGANVPEAVMVMKGILH
jgi:hypothetical protein